MWAVSDLGLTIAAILLDTENAFDRVEWGHLFRILEVFGFGETFIKLIHLLCNQAEAAVQTNGYTVYLLILSQGGGHTRGHDSVLYYFVWGYNHWQLRLCVMRIFMGLCP